jgi:hypothetical protein
MQSKVDERETSKWKKVSERKIDQPQVEKDTTHFCVEVVWPREGSCPQLLTVFSLASVLAPAGGISRRTEQADMEE